VVSLISVPVTSRGQPLGALTLARTSPGSDYGADELALAEDLAARVGIAIDRARLYLQVEERADAARVLTYVADAVVLLDRADAISGVKFFGGTVYAFRDVTEGRQLEELKADFIATASHVLRTPLAAVYGAAQTLLRLDFALDEAGRDRFVSLIAEESERLGRIVNEILLANQLDSGRVDLGTEPFDPIDLVERVAEAARTHAPTEIAVERVTPERAPLVAADRDK